MNKVRVENNDHTYKQQLEYFCKCKSDGVTILPLT